MEVKVYKSIWKGTTISNYFVNSPNKYESENKE